MAHEIKHYPSSITCIKCKKRTRCLLFTTSKPDGVTVALRAGVVYVCQWCGYLSGKELPLLPRSGEEIPQEPYRETDDGELYV